jgi:predicted dehydrogenase
VKFLIAGLGSIGRRHLRNLLALGEEDIVLYRTGKSTLPDEELERFPTEPSLEDALSHEPDAVIVSNPTSMHLAVAVPAARAGCALLIEKPVSHNLDHVRELETIVRENENRVLVGYQFRFHPVLGAIRNIITEGKCGTIFMVQAYWGEYLPDWHPWEDFTNSYAARQNLGGGVVLTLSHPIDYLNWLFGNAASVWGWTDQRSGWGLDVEDTADFFIKHTSDVISRVHLNYLQRPGRHDLAILGTKGSVHWSNEDGSGLFIEAGSGIATRLSAPESFTRNDLFVAEIEHFCDVIYGRAQPACTLEDGIHALRIALSVLEGPGLDDMNRLIPL